MGILANFRVHKIINAVLSTPDMRDPGTAQAVATLKAMGSTAILQLIATLDRDRVPNLVQELLIALLRDNTLPLYVKELAHPNHRIVAGVTTILSVARTYNPCKRLNTSPMPSAPELPSLRS